MAKISIIVEDNAVYVDGRSFTGLDLSSCNIPTNVWALQWDGSAGEVEYDNREENTAITELPTWVNNCVTKWQGAEDARIAAEAEAAAAESEVTPET